jgi:hypothetical protein
VGTTEKFFERICRKRCHAAGLLRGIEQVMNSNARGGSAGACPGLGANRSGQAG